MENYKKLKSVTLYLCTKELSEYKNKVDKNVNQVIENYFGPIDTRVYINCYFSLSSHSLK